MFPEKTSSVLTMSQDFTTNLLESIRKSEATTIEKQRRIQDCLEAIGELSASAQASENACRNLKQEIDDAKDRIAGKRASSHHPRLLSGKGRSRGSGGRQSAAPMRSGPSAELRRSG